jgi:hypothetical protein
MIEDTNPLHELEGREGVSTDAGRSSLWRIVIVQNDFRVVRVKPGLQKPSPAQIDVGIQKQPYQLCIERSEYLPATRLDAQCW